MIKDYAPYAKVITESSTNGYLQSTPVRIRKTFSEIEQMAKLIEAAVESHLVSHIGVRPTTLYVYPLSSGNGRHNGGLVYLNAKAGRVAFCIFDLHEMCYHIRTRKGSRASESITSWDEHASNAAYAFTSKDITKTVEHILHFLVGEDAQKDMEVSR